MNRNSLFVLARQEGFDPPTHGLEGRCSIQLSYGRIRSLEGFRQASFPLTIHDYIMSDALCP